MKTHENLKTYTAGEEDTIALFIATKYQAAADDFEKRKQPGEAPFAGIAQMMAEPGLGWAPAYMVEDAPVRPARLTTAGADRIRRKVIRYINEWAARRSQGAA